MRPSGAELLGRAQKLRPALLARQAEAERLRRLPAATIEEFHEAGILRAIQPVAFGGFETDFIDQTATRRSKWRSFSDWA